MKKLIFIFCCVCVHEFAHSQVQLQDPLSGKVLSVSKYANISGSPFLFDDWKPGKVKTPKGVYAALNLKYDAYSSTLFFQRNDESYEFADPIESFILSSVKGDDSRDMYFVNGLEATDLRKNQFVQELCSGKISLYKSVMVFMTEVNKINEGIVKSFNKSERFYVKRDGSLEQLRSGKKEFLALFGSAAMEIETYATTNELSFRKTEDLVKMANYYNNKNK